MNACILHTSAPDTKRCTHYGWSGTDLPPDTHLLADLHLPPAPRIPRPRQHLIAVKAAAERRVAAQVGIRAYHSDLAEERAFAAASEASDAHQRTPAHHDAVPESFVGEPSPPCDEVACHG
jgi:hypothetical protein